MRSFRPASHVFLCCTVIEINLLSSLASHKIRCAENVVGNLVFAAYHCLLMLPALLDVVVTDAVIGERCPAPVAQQVVLTVQSTSYVGCVIRSVAQSFWVNMLRQHV